MLEFSIAFLKHTPADENICFSPFSLQQAFAMTYAGAEGATKSQMEAIFHFTDDIHATFQERRQVYTSEQDPKIQVANRLFMDGSLTVLQSYQSLLTEKYAVNVQRLPFRTQPEEARQEINQWVSGQTDGKIEELLPTGAITPLTRLALVNALTFIDKWKQSFPTEHTDMNGQFRLSETERKTLPMMFQESELRYAEDDAWQVVELPYSGDLAMMIWLPKEGLALSELRPDFNTELVNALSDGLITQKIKLYLPRFELRSTVPAKDYLMAMGLENPFLVERADLSRMTGGRELFIENLYHQAVVKVDESGTEAAAATAVVAVRGARPGSAPPVMRVDRPFFFMIHHSQTKEVLFFAQLIEP